MGRSGEGGRRGLRGIMISIYGVCGVTGNSTAQRRLATQWHLTTLMDSDFNAVLGGT